MDSPTSCNSKFSLGCLEQGTCVLTELVFLFSVLLLGSWISPRPTILATLDTPSYTRVPRSIDSVPLPGIKSIEKQMLHIEGGKFDLGGQVVCYISGFELGKYEVTQAQWKQVMGESRGFFSDCPTCPVEGVSWYEVQEFIYELNKKTRGGFRLPSEAEWEFAAKGGSQARAYIFAGGDSLKEVGWFLGNSERKTQPVGSLSPNSLGLYDMSGNVWEWCSDWYEDEFPSGPLKNPKGPIQGEDRVVRGGSWYVYPEFCSLTYRFKFPPFLKNNHMGFRLARDPKN